MQLHERAFLTPLGYGNHSVGVRRNRVSSFLESAEATDSGAPRLKYGLCDPPTADHCILVAQRSALLFYMVLSEVQFYTISGRIRRFLPISGRIAHVGS